VRTWLTSRVLLLPGPTLVQLLDRALHAARLLDGPTISKEPPQPLFIGAWKSYECLHTDYGVIITDVFTYAMKALVVVLLVLLVVWTWTPSTRSARLHSGGTVCPGAGGR
jgi:hypothetical protein